MKPSLHLPAHAFILGGVLALTFTFTGCAETQKPEAPSVPTATTAAAPQAKGDLSVAKMSLENAVVALKDKNYVDALNHVDIAGKEVSTAASNANLPAPIKETLTKAGANLEPLRALIEKQDASAEKGLLASIASLSKLAELNKLLSDSGALGELMKSTEAQNGAALRQAAQKEANQTTPKKP